MTALLVVATLLTACTDRETDIAQRPNIILVLADDLGYGDLSSYGQDQFSTPNIDRLATEGMRFTDHYAGAPVCAPSRCALMTGLHTGHCRVRANFGIAAAGERIRVPLTDSDVTVAEVLQEAGYRTGLFGKWGLGEPGSPGVPWSQGFDRFSGFLNQANAHNHYPPAYWHDQENIPVAENVNDTPDDDVYIDDVFLKDVIQFIREPSDAPFFVYYSPTLPHSDMSVPEDSISEFRGRYPLVTYQEEHYIQDDVRAAYPAMVTRLDGYVGRILHVLDEEDIADDTIVVFVSDNGPHASDGNDPDFFNSSGGLRGHKSSLYEGGIRVPMLVRWPDRVPAGSESGYVSAFWDFLPTFAEIAGVSEPIDGDGASLMPALLGKAVSADDRPMYWEYGHRRFGGQQAVRLGNFKAYRHNPDAPTELYDLASDVVELQDIAKARPELVAEMERLFESSRNEDRLYPLVREN